MADRIPLAEQRKRAADGGRAARAWRWFSRRTIRSAERFRDVSWREVTVRLAVAAAAFALARAFRQEAFAPFLAVAAGAAILLTLRVAAIKALDAAGRR